jgi:hypothetical protein
MLSGERGIDISKINKSTKSDGRNSKTVSVSQSHQL